MIVIKMIIIKIVMERFKSNCTQWSLTESLVTLNGYKK